MLKLKDNSIIPHFSPGMLFGILVVDQVYEEVGVPETVITSGMDAQHSRGSRHYTGDAADFRTRNATDEQKDKIVVALRNRLNEHYDVILETDHLHVEYHPKRLR